jgi:putative sensor protein
LRDVKDLAGPVRSARAAGYCAGAALRGLAMVVLLPVLIYSAVLCLIGLGLLVLPTELRLLRQLADGERRRVGRWVAVAAPAGPHVRRTLAAMLGEPATMRDLRWVPGMLFAGLVLGIVGVEAFLLPLAAFADIGLWWLFPADDPIRFVANLPIDSWTSAVVVGAPKLLVSVLFGPQWIVVAAAAASRWLLSPSPLAERVSTWPSSRTGVPLGGTPSWSGIEKLRQRRAPSVFAMTTNTRIRRFHRVMAVTFTVTVVGTAVALAQENPAAWVSYVPLFPLALLFFTGLYLFALPHVARRRERVKTG